MCLALLELETKLNKPMLDFQLLARLDSIALLKIQKKTKKNNKKKKNLFTEGKKQPDSEQSDHIKTFLQAKPKARCVEV
jgi:hypothetical protein